jgi:hypothetical protein
LTLRRLVSVVEPRDDMRSPRQQSFGVVLYAELDDGRRLVLLDDRGWGGSMHSTDPDAPVDIWAHTEIAGLEETARTVVGPDEPPAGRTHEEEAALHWTALARRLNVEDVDGPTLRQAPHDVELSDALRRRLFGEG